MCHVQIPKRLTCLNTLQQPSAFWWLWSSNIQKGVNESNFQCFKVFSSDQLVMEPYSQLVWAKIFGSDLPEKTEFFDTTNNSWEISRGHQGELVFGTIESLWMAEAYHFLLQDGHIPGTMMEICSPAWWENEDDQTLKTTTRIPSAFGYLSIHYSLQFIAFDPRYNWSSN